MSNLCWGFESPASVFRLSECGKKDTKSGWYVLLCEGMTVSEWFGSLRIEITGVKESAFYTACAENRKTQGLCIYVQGL